MRKEIVLCSKCAAIMGNSFKVSEVSRREKVSCENCGKRGYGCTCVVEDRKGASKDGTGKNR